MAVCVLLRITAGVVLIGDVIQANRYMILAEIKKCHVRYWIAWKCGIRISNILYSMCVWM